MWAQWEGHVCPVKRGALVAPGALRVHSPERAPSQAGTVGGTEQQKAGLLPSLSVLAPLFLLYLRHQVSGPAG